MKHFVGQVVRALLGPEHTRTYVKQAKREACSFAARLDKVLDGTSVPVVSTESPVFIFSAGWRSGSTLLQRMMMQNNPNLLIWGEPFNYSNILDGLMNQLRPFTAQWPRDSYYLSNRKANSLSDQGVANLYPDNEALLRSHLALLEELLAAPARAQGFSQWGAKEVRWSADHARYLKALYPGAKFLFLYRNPFDAYESFYRICDGWFTDWPRKMIATPYAFGTQWAKLARSFLENHRALGAILVRYEDLDRPEQAGQLAEYLGWPVPRASQLRRLSADQVERKDLKATPLPWIDKMLLYYAVKQVKARAGY